jgi:hypothetical protein
MKVLEWIVLYLSANALEYCPYFFLACCKKSNDLLLVSDAAYYYVISSPNPSGQFHNVEGYIHALGSGQGVNGQ